ncbi:MAG: 1-deoxy-D-xylulose-5-phosphate synthase, partial [Lachnospiraceae bacterium]|nr:1-deoxy-D-xylulose-5-phosphate synthase [Lachnospiraceae bacterium]
EPFDVSTGMPKKVREKANYTDVFATMMCKLAKQKPELVAVSAAMAEGTGLKRFANMHPDRFFDVGIAEEHGVTFAAGLAAGGLHPVVAIYSSFLQRAYDQILHDVCLQGLPVVFAVDRAGLVGSDGETHQGIFDLSYLSSIPGMTVMAPKNKWELADMLEFALEQEGPCAIRYPRGEAYDGLKEKREAMAYGKCEVIDQDEDAQICLIAVGSMVKTAEEVAEKLRADGHRCMFINARFVKPIDPAMAEYARGRQLVVTMEENVISGGFGEQFRELLDERVPAEVRPKQLCIALPDAYVEHGNVDILKHETEIDAESVYYRILEALN